MEILYTAHATASGGGREDGHSKTDDGKLDVKLSTPKEMGGSGGDGTNPEQLFATGYSACFLVGFGKRDDGEGFGLKVILTAAAPGLDTEALKDVMDRAHIICPYSHATRGNIEVELKQA